MNILSEMSSIYYELTISEKRIAEYILECRRRPVLS